MQAIQIPGTHLTVSRLSFGTASLHHIFSGKQREVLLASAIDAGFTHVDTSPYYGFGLGEVALGQLPATLRNRITVTTKVGLYPPDGASAHIPGILLRKVLGKGMPALNKPVVDWQVSTAQASLERSLRRLQRDQVSCLMLHEPQAALIHCEEWQRWLEDCQQAGKIGYWGIAGEVSSITGMLATHVPLAPLVQVRDSIDTRQAQAVRAQRPLQFTYGYLSQRPAGMQTEEVIRQALQQNATGSVIVSTRQTGHIHALVQAAREAGIKYPA